MIPSITPTQSAAFKAWVIACLNRTDDGADESPLLFSHDNVVWSHTDLPRLGDLYALLREVTYIALGEPQVVRETVNAGQPDESLIERTHQIHEWTCSVQVVSKLSDSNPAYAQAAGRYLRRVTMRVQAELADPMRTTGLAWRRSGQILPLPRIARSTQWETRSAVDLTFAAGEYIVERPGWIDSATVTGTASPLPADTFTADHEDDLDNLP